MSKPVGVTISAVLVVLGSFLWMIFGLLALVGMVMQGAETPMSPWVQYGSVSFMILVPLWGLLTGVGLFMWKHWARVSVLVFAGVVSFTFATLILLDTLYWLIQGNSLLGGQEGVVFIVFLLPVGISIWWLVLFTRDSLKSHFSQPAKVSRRPASITVISIFLIVGAVSVVLSALFTRTAYLGHFFTGWPAVVVSLGIGAFGSYVGVGLFRLEESARKLTFLYFAFTILNLLLYTFDPNLESYIAQINTQLGTVPMEQGAAPVDQIALQRAVLIYAVILYGAALWFLVKRNEAFVAPEESALPPFPEPPSAD